MKREGRKRERGEKVRKAGKLGEAEKGGRGTERGGGVGSEGRVQTDRPHPSPGRCWEARGCRPGSGGFPSGLAWRRDHPMVSVGEAGHRDSCWSPGRCAPGQLWWLMVQGYQAWLSCAPLPRGGRGRPGGGPGGASMRWELEWDAAGVRLGGGSGPGG